MQRRVGVVGARPEMMLDLAVAAAAAGVGLVPIGDDMAASHPVVAPSGTGPERFPDGGPLALLLVDVDARSAQPGPGPADLIRGPAGGSGRPGAPLGSGAPLLVVHRSGETARALEVADLLGCSRVLELPRGVGWLTEELTGPVRPPVIAVVGAVGGVGTSTVAIACAAAAAPDCLLVDVDPHSAGLDLPLGIEDGQGRRWEAIPDGDEPLVVESVRAALPRVGAMSVLTGPMPARVGRRLDRVIEVGRSGYSSTVLDVGRGGRSVLAAADAVVVVCPATLAGLVSTRLLLGQIRLGIPVVLAVRPSGWLSPADLSDELPVPAIVQVPRLNRLGELADCGELMSGRTGRALRALGSELWAALA